MLSGNNMAKILETQPSLYPEKLKNLSDDYDNSGRSI